MSETSSSRSISIDSLSGNYPVVIGDGISSADIDLTSSLMIIDEFFSGRYPDERIVLVEATEEKKTLDSVEQVIVSLRGLGLQRDGHIYAVGGGIVQDIATLAASLYMRGVQWTYVPTTLMAMTDSCIGGKSSINAGRVKNLIGNIYPPSKVVIDISFIKTLDSVGIVSGLAEAVKITFCKGPSEFSSFLSVAGDPTSIDYVEMLHLVLKSKKWFIEIDEFDRAERRLLNFGHTFGHALEVGSSFAIPHGIAVALGMQAALNFVSKTRRLAGIECWLEAYVDEIMRYATMARGVSVDVDEVALMSAFEADKKHSKTHFRLVLTTASGGVEIVEVPRSDWSRHCVLEALTEATEKYL